MKLKTMFRKLRNKNLDYLNKVGYWDSYKNLPVDPNAVVLESQHGDNLNGNIFYLLKELETNPEYSDYKIYLIYKKGKKKDFEDLLASHNLNAALVRFGSKEYYTLMASAGVLITDTSFFPFYTKKEGQRILNTWHGTPLKHMGKKDASGLLSLGNIQRNFIMSDYILFPNEYMRDHMIEDYMLENIAPGKSLMAGYPRNDIFFDQNSAKEVRQKLRDKGIVSAGVNKVYAYMPTWRGTVGDVSADEQIERVQKYLKEIDDLLDDDEIMLVNLHPFVSNAVDYSEFKKIKPFDKRFETYELLNASDALVTDYSSVFFDYANTGKPVVLFAYDFDEYFENRGIYGSLHDFPFPIVHTSKELVKNLRNGKTYSDEEFREKFNTYDGPDSSKKILSQFMLGKDEALEEIDIPDNGKNNVLIYGGNLAKNGISSSLKSLLNHIDTDKRNYFISYSPGNSKAKKEFIEALPEGVNYLPMPGRANASISQKVSTILARRNRIAPEKIKVTYDEIFPADLKRLYPGRKFTDVIHFTGYDYKRLQAFGRYPANRTVFVHNNVGEEIRLKNVMHDETLRYAYDEYDHVAIVTPDLLEPTSEYSTQPDKIKVVHNTIEADKIRKMGDEPMHFDENTQSTATEEELQQILDSDSKKFISVGRFSPEKGHKRLMETFDKLWKDNPDTYLIIVGGYGSLFDETLAFRESLASKDHIVIVKSMSNPQPVIRQSDYFVLSSFHEGMGLVLLEASIQGLPVISTDIPGPHGFMSDLGGTLVENTNEGLYEGMNELLHGEIPVLNIDYDAYNKQSVDEFESIMQPAKNHAG